MKRTELVELLCKVAATLHAALEPLDQFELAKVPLGQVQAVVRDAVGTISLQEGALGYIAAKLEKEGVEP